MENIYRIYIIIAYRPLEEFIYSFHQMERIFNEMIRIIMSLYGGR